MTKEIAQTVGGKRIAWLLAILAAFAVFATVAHTWRNAEADVTATDFTVTGPFTDAAATVPATGAVSAGTTIYYLVTAGPLTAGYQTPLAVTANTGGSGTFVSVNPGGAPAPSCGATGGTTITCTYAVTGGGGETFTLILGVNATADFVAGVTDDVCSVGEFCVLVDDASAQAAAEATNTTTALTLFNFETLTSKTASVLSIPGAGGTFFYTLSYGPQPVGAGTIAAGDLTFSDVVPAPLVVDSVTSSANMTCTESPDNTVNCVSNADILEGESATAQINVSVPANTTGATLSITNTADFAATFLGQDFTDSDSVTLSQIAVATGVGLKHVDVDQGSEHAADGNFGVLPGFEDEDEAIGSLHTVCIFGLGLTAADNVLITWNIQATELSPTVSNFAKVSGNALPLPVGDVPCAQWRSAAVGDQSIYATLGLLQLSEVAAEQVATTNIYWDTTSIELADGTTPLIKEWNSIDVTKIVSATAAELANWDNNKGTSTTCVRDRDAFAGDVNCVDKTNLDGTVVSVTGTLTAGGGVSASSRSFIDYTLGSHTTHYNGPIDGARQSYTIGGSCGSLSVEDTVFGGMLGPITSGSLTTLTSNYGVGFTVNATDCGPGESTTVTIRTVQDVQLTSAVDTAPDETITVTWFAANAAKQPLLAWAGQRIALERFWGDVGRCADGGAVSALYQIENGGGAFVPDSDLGSMSGEDFLASLGTNNSEFAGDFECTSIAIYEQEFQGQVDIKASVDDLIYNFLVYYMEFEDVNLGIVGGSRAYHNNGGFDATGDPWDASTDTASAEANVSADVLLRARVRGWFKTSSLDTEGTNRPAEDGKPSGRFVMPDDWLLLAGGESALLFRPNYDIMVTPGGSALNSDGTISGPFSLLDPGPGENSMALFSGEGGGAYESWLPDGQINMWDAPMPPALITFSYVGETATSTATSSGFLKNVSKCGDVYGGQNPFCDSQIPASPFISPQNYLWDSFGFTGDPDGPYPFWISVLNNRYPLSGAASAFATNTELAQIAAYVESRDPGSSVARIKNVYSDNHGEAMVFANGDFRLTYADCDTNVIGGGKHCAQGDKVGSSNVFAVADYPDFKKKPQIASDPVTIDWTWGGYKETTIEAGETDQFRYVVFHAVDRDGFCNIPLVQEQAFDVPGDGILGGDDSGALKPVYLTAATGGSRTFTNTGIPSLVQRSISLHPVLSSLDATNTIGANDPVESVDFTVDAGEGIIIGSSGGGTIDGTKRFAEGLPTFSTATNTTIKEFPTLHGTSDECQAWIRVSNSLLTILNVIVVAHDDEGDIGFDAIVDFQGTFTYNLSFRWSLITWVGPDNIPVEDALKGTGANDSGNDIFDEVTAVYGWDQAAQQWLGFFPTGVNVPGANDLTVLETGQAYWIAIKGPDSVEWTVATNVGG